MENFKLFTSREYEPELDLYYYRSRYYDAKIGKFTSRDPLLYVDGPNVYSYVNNNPVNYVDPWGLEKGLLNGLRINRIDYQYKGPLADGNGFINGMQDAGVFMTNSVIAAENHVINITEDAIDDLDYVYNNSSLSQPNGKNPIIVLVDKKIKDTYDFVNTTIDYYKNTQKEQIWNDVKTLVTDPETWENMGAVGIEITVTKKISGNKTLNNNNIKYEADVVGSTRSSHRYHANKQYYNSLPKNSSIAKEMLQPNGTLKNPANSVWHHPIENPNKLYLLDKDYHTSLHKNSPIGGWSMYYK